MAQVAVSSQGLNGSAVIPLAPPQLVAGSIRAENISILFPCPGRTLRRSTWGVEGWALIEAPSGGLNKRPSEMARWVAVAVSLGCI